ncbi:MAG: phosphoglycerate mutase [Blastopirellula sp.]|nr:MAG: phosphoglycerate mutase [Blastopirellula sp.]
MQIALIRPGCTDYDQQGRIRGTLDIPMNSDGNAQVATEIEQISDLAVSIIYTGPCSSAVETAEAISSVKSAKVKKIDRFQNLDAGLWQGKLVSEVKQNQPKVYKQWQENPDAICPPEGEMLGEARQRVRIGLDKILKKHLNTDKVVAIVAPEPIASIIRSELLHENIGNLWKAECQCGNWEIIDCSPATAAS